MIDLEAFGAGIEPGKTDERHPAEPSSGFRWVAPLMAIVPILEIYESPVEKISWGGISLMVLSLLGGTILISKRKANTPTVRTSPLVFVLVLLAITALGAIVQTEVLFDFSSIMNRFAMLFLWAVAVAIAGAALCEPLRIARWVQSVAVIGTVFLLVQWAAWHATDVLIPSVLNNGFIKPSSEGYADVAYLESYYQAFYFRPASFFAEPQYFADYASLALILTLFGRQIRFRTAIAVFLSIGLIVSTSTTGLILGTLIWACFLFRSTGRSHANKPASNPLRLVLPLLVPLLLLAYAGGLLRNFLKIDSSKLDNVLASGRVGGSFDLLGYLQRSEVLLGVGIGNEDWLVGSDHSYYNSVTAIGLGAGIMGLVAVLGLLVHLLFQSTGPSRLVLVAYALLSMSGSMLYSDRSVLWLWFALYGASLFPRADSNGSTVDRTDVVRRQDIPRNRWNGLVRNDRDQSSETNRLRRNSYLLSR